MNKITTTKLFIDTFINKIKKDRASFLLANPKKRIKFTDELNHNVDVLFNMKYLTLVDKTQNNMRRYLNLELVGF